MRHSIRHRPQMRGVTAQRLAAAERALRAERTRYALFASELVQEAPEERILRVDQEVIDQDQGHRDLAAQQWRMGRKLARIHPDLLDAWNESTIPAEAHYFADFMHTRVRAILRETVTDFSGDTVRSLMRRYRVTIRELSRRMGITMKRIREVRENGLTDRLAIRDWIQGITEVDPGRL